MGRPLQQKRNTSERSAIPIAAQGPSVLLNAYFWSLAADGKSEGTAKTSPAELGPIGRSASTRALSPAPLPEDLIRRTHSALGTRDGEGPPGFEKLSLDGNDTAITEGASAAASLESLIKSPVAAVQAGKSISLTDIQAAINAADPEVCPCKPHPKTLARGI